jgi:hypothetical protein
MDHDHEWWMLERQAVAGSQHCSPRQGGSELDAGVGPASGASLESFLPA